MLNEKNKFTLLIVICVVSSLVIGAISGAVASAFSKNLVANPINAVLAKFFPEKNTGPDVKKVRVEEESSTIDAVKKVSSSVVSVIISKDLSKIKSFNNGFFPFEFLFPEQVPDEQGVQKIGGGTGFIITSDGYILTNKHVISDSEAQYSVIFSDGTEYDASIAGSDFSNDIAVLKIEAKDLPVASIGDSDSLAIGQTVIAIGNALSEYPNTVTKGIVSGINRSVTAGDNSGYSELIEGAIQTDAAINQGNSGGPLINLSGEVIGINTAVSMQGQSVGFAIPINTAKKAVEDIKNFGKIVRPWLGVRYVMLNEKNAKTNSLPVDYGALVVRGNAPTELAVIPGSPADKAGIEENDIILEADGEKLTEDNNLAKVLSKYKPNDSVTLKIYHKGDKKDIKVTIEEAPQNPESVNTEEKNNE